MTPEQALSVIERERLDVLAEGMTVAECQEIAAYVLATEYRKRILGPGMPQWIRIADRQPDFDQILMVRMKDGSILGGIMRSSRGFVSKFTQWNVHDVTHWMPMPPHPEDSHPATGIPQEKS